MLDESDSVDAMLAALARRRMLPEGSSIGRTTSFTPLPLPLPLLPMLSGEARAALPLPGTGNAAGDTDDACG